MPAVYDPAFQQDAVVNSQIPEEGAKPITSHSSHCGDLGDHETGVSVRLVAGGRAAFAAGVPGSSLRLQTCCGPRHTWEYIQAQGRAQEMPRRGIFLAAVPLPGGMGIPWTPVWQGGRDYRRRIRGLFAVAPLGREGNGGVDEGGRQSEGRRPVAQQPPDAGDGDRHAAVPLSTVVDACRAVQGGQAQAERSAKQHQATASNQQPQCARLWGGCGRRSRGSQDGA